MVKNNIVLNEQGIIEITVTGGDRTADSVQAAANKVFEIGQKLRDAGKPVLVLNRLLPTGKVSAEAQETLANICKTGDFDRFAFVGLDRVLRLSINLLARAIDKTESLKYFEDYDEAVAWLESFKHKK